MNMIARKYIAEGTSPYSAEIESPHKITDLQLTQCLRGLQVVDPSALPLPVWAHYQVLVYAIAHKEAGLIMVFPTSAPLQIAPLPSEMIGSSCAVGGKGQKQVSYIGSPKKYGHKMPNQDIDFGNGADGA
ncbi:hypothetical protein BDW75DRAFT_242920 [Aspergillus navahoensis]